MALITLDHGRDLHEPGAQRLIALLRSQGHEVAYPSPTKPQIKAVDERRSGAGRKGAV